MTKAVIESGYLVIYRGSIEVARFPRDDFPSIMLEMAKALKE